MTTEKIKALVEKHHGEATKIRQAIHMNPELGFEEHETAKLIAQTLEKHGIKARTGVAKTGVVGLIEGARPGKTVLLRADMDALAMTEEADVPYKSRKPGVMHACGHDGHVAGLLLCAMALNEMKGEMRGNVKLMFQPAEEMKGGGALPMIEEGVLEYPKVDAAFGCHLWGDGIEGQVRVRSGPTMASPDEFHIKIIGKGGHGASPHKAVDPVPLAAQVIMAFQTLASRRVDPLEPVVISICAVRGGTVHNIIP
ncbi:MAG: amidohydrolase, partial [Treponema sp.]|nr:amidohydrolase [Treponema sp.]